MRDPAQEINDRRSPPPGVPGRTKKAGPAGPASSSLEEGCL